MPLFRNELFRSSAYVFFSRVLAILFGFATMVVVARWYGAEAAGFYGVLNSMGQIFGTFAAFGLSTLLVRELAASDPLSAALQRRQLYFRAVTTVIGLALILFIPAYLLITRVFPSGGEEVLWFGALVVAGVMFGRALMQLTVDTSRVLVPVPIFAAYLLLPPALGLIVVISWALVYEVHFLIAGFALAVGTLVTALVAFSVNMRRLPAASIPVENSNYSRAFGSAFNLLRAGFPFLVANGSAIVVLEGNMVIAGMMLPPEEVADYAIAHRISLLAVFALSSIQLVVQPRFARLAAEKDIEGLRSYGRSASALVFFTSIPIIGLFVLFRNQIVEIGFGQEFHQTSALLAVLLIGRTVEALTGATNPYLTMTGGQKYLARIITVSAILTIVLSLILTPVFGVFGPAVSMAVCLTFWNLAALIVIRVRDGFWLCWIPRALRDACNMSGGR